MSERDIRKLLLLVEKHLGAEWRDVADWLRDQNSIDAIEARLLAGDYAGLVREVESAARRFAVATHESYLTAGREGAKWLDEQIPDRLVRFDVTSDRAVYAARQNELELVYGMSDEQRVVARQVLVEGQTAGLNPRTIARDLRDSIGLNPQQEKAIRSYRRALESGDFGNALGRELSSGHSDRAIRGAARAERALTEQQIDVAVERYRANQLTARAEAIARTEAAKSVHAGLHESFSQAIERGDIEAGQLVREWIWSPGRRGGRAQHRAMNGQERKFNEPFEAPDGTRLMWPGYGPPSHAVNCRCTVGTSLLPAAA